MYSQFMMHGQKNIKLNNMYVTLRSSTCFELHPAHPQDDKLYYYILWYRHSL